MDPIVQSDQYTDYYVPGTPLVNQKQFTCYYSRGDEGLNAVLETYSNGYRWNLVRSWDNDTGGTAEYTVRYTTEFRVRTGYSLETSWNIGFQYKGMSVGIGGGNKTFREDETTTTTMHEQKITIPPRSKLFFYQKVYRFDVKVWFILDAWNELSRVGGRWNYKPSVVTGSIEIHSDDYYTRDVELRYGSTTTTAEEVQPVVRFKWTRMFENCTERCKRYLLNHGVDPPRALEAGLEADSSEKLPDEAEDDGGKPCAAVIPFSDW
ncbi:hypothetical protein F4805DRAFT_90013 [Annulohypoxylon moriforme]|nr:hypothetical protein F4805DRAFT_90013 [Annulohypoxylon moriforme]